jgi:hypothetical protein
LIVSTTGGLLALVDCMDERSADQRVWLGKAKLIFF